LSYARKLAFCLQSFRGIHGGSSKYWPNPSISVDAGQQGCSAIGSPRRLPSEGKVTRSNRVGCANFSLFYSALCAPGLKVQFSLIRTSKQSRENRRRVQIAWQLTMSVRSSNNNCFHKSYKWRWQAAASPVGYAAAPEDSHAWASARCAAGFSES